MDGLSGRFSNEGGEPLTFVVVSTSGGQGFFNSVSCENCEGRSREVCRDAIETSLLQCNCNDTIKGEESPPRRKSKEDREISKNLSMPRRQHMATGLGVMVVTGID